MPGALKVREGDNGKQVPDVQAVRRGIEPHVDRGAFGLQVLRKRRVAAILDESANLQLLKVARVLARETRFFTLAESLGGVESLVELPAPMTHASVAGSPLEIDPGLVRISVGIENAEDLVADLARVLARA